MLVVNKRQNGCKKLIFPHKQVILISVDSGRKWLESWRKDLWEACHIGIPDSDTESLNVLLFGALVAWFLGKVSFV